MYWDDAELDDPEDRKHLDVLLREGAEREQRVVSLERLLDSPSIVAQGIAINWWSNDQMSGRWGTIPASAVLKGKVAQRIREHLAAPPHWIATRMSGQIAMNYASALAALRWVIVPGDARMIADVAAQASDPWTKSSLVLAARRCLDACYRARASADEAIAHRVLVDLAADEHLESGDREEAIAHLDPRSADVEHLLLRLLERTEVDLAAAAAIALMRGQFAKHRKRIAERLEEWEGGSATVATAREVYDSAAQQADTDQ